jgi:chromosome segregation ATPase
MTENSEFPEKIYLQSIVNGEYQFHVDTTWCEEKIDETDVKYVRADLFTSQLAEKDKEIEHYTRENHHLQADKKKSEQQLTSQLAEKDKKIKEWEKKHNAWFFVLDKEIRDYQQQLTDLKAKLARYEKALEFYADKKNYLYDQYATVIDKDNGKRATEALNKEKNNE